MEHFFCGQQCWKVVGFLIRETQWDSRKGEQERSLEESIIQFNVLSLFFFFFLISKAGYRAEQRAGGQNPITEPALLQRWQYLGQNAAILRGWRTAAELKVSTGSGAKHSFFIQRAQNPPSSIQHHWEGAPCHGRQSWTNAHHWSLLHRAEKSALPWDSDKISQRIWISTKCPATRALRTKLMLNLSSKNVTVRLLALESNVKCYPLSFSYFECLYFEVWLQASLCTQTFMCFFQTPSLA